MKYVKYLAWALFRARSVWACILVLAISFALPLFHESPVFGPQMIAASMQSTLDALSALNEGDASLMPDAVFHRLLEERDVLQKGLSSQTPDDFYRHASRYFAMTVEDMDSGMLVGDRAFNEGASLFCKRLASMPSGDFDTSGDMPLLCHATYAIASIPVFVWYVPAIIVVLTVGGLSHGEGLLARAPLPRGRKFLLEGAVGAVLVVIVLACAYAPSALIALVRNGVGNPSYPIFCSVDGTLFLLPALDSYIGAGVVLLFGNVLVYFAALAIGCLLHSLSVGALLAFLLPVSTMTEAFAGAVPSFLSDALPTTYLDPSVLFGHAGGFPSAAVEAVNHASPVIACAVQLLWIVAIAVVACTALRVSISPWPKRARW